MNLIYEDKLIEYMKHHNKSNILVEVIQSNASDFEVTELHLRFISEKAAENMTTKQRYRRVEAPFGGLLMPPYRLEVADTVNLYLKKFGFIHWIKQVGIKL